ncbi:MAG: response regulator, partial [Oscillibacter sp.]|nr:response regulator [Oscillibacter sp.]
MKKTMIVDDDHLVRSYLKILPSWERAGFRIEADAQDGEEALSILESMEIDLLVTDISMPLLNGIELIRRIRQVDQRVYIIALSCHDEFAFVRDALK